MKRFRGQNERQKSLRPLRGRNAGPNTFAKKSLRPLRGRKAAPMEPNFRPYKQFYMYLYRVGRLRVSKGSPPTDHGP